MPRAASPLAAALGSALVPGLGQWLAGRRERGLAVLLGTAAAAVAVAQLGPGPLLWLLAPWWLAQVVDAATVAGGRRPRTAALVLLWALPVYLAGWRLIEAHPGRLVSGFPRVQPLFRGFLAPDLLTRASLADVSTEVRVLTPCPATTPPEAALDDAAPSVRVSPACAPLGATVTVSGAGWGADRTVVLTWLGPTGETSAAGETRTDDAGRFETAVTIARDSIPRHIRERRPDLPQNQGIRVTAPGPPGPLRPSANFRLVLDSMAVTIGAALVATLLGALLAVPLAVLGARNLMAGHALTRAIYGVVRTVMNVLRSIEPVILAVVFVVWVGQGPFAGTMALVVHSVAALGKLFSESIEAIDPGPVEAVRASGASWLQTVVYAVLPQVVPPFAAFTVYRWDINVRMSTVIGLVGGGGIGYILSQWIYRSQWRQASTALIVIAVVIMAMDLLSATVRARVAAGRPLLPGRARLLGYVAVAVLVAWAWRTAEMAPALLVGNAGKVRPYLGDLARPRLLARDRVTETVATALVVPCALERAGAVQPAVAPAATVPGAEVRLDVRCADAGDIVAVAGRGLRPGATGELNWRLPDGRRLTASRVTVDARGTFRAPVEVRPLLASQGEEQRRAIGLEATTRWEVGPQRPSPELTTTLRLLVQTILMALWATTLGALVALPLAFVGARNLVPRHLAGDGLYYGARLTMNVLRSIEPLILAIIFRNWVGAGSPFAGVLALAIVTVANLGKLFSEAVESIDPGPVEAVRATGAGRAQEVAYGVIPQVIPPFLSFGIYHWDINVRISTVIGFVGGGGIGYVLYQWMNQLRWSAAAVAILGIILVVGAMDYLSARVRQRLI